ncbi:hypothetical protein BsWGS_11761 [Bradybaena similaris]
MGTTSGTAQKVDTKSVNCCFKAMNTKLTHTLSHPVQNQVCYCTLVHVLTGMSAHPGATPLFPTKDNSVQIPYTRCNPPPPPPPHVSVIGSYMWVSPIVYASTGESPNNVVRVQKQAPPMQVALAKSYKHALKWVCQSYTPLAARRGQHHRHHGHTLNVVTLSPESLIVVTFKSPTQKKQATCCYSAHERRQATCTQASWENLRPNLTSRISISDNLATAARQGHHLCVVSWHI